MNENPYKAIVVLVSMPLLAMGIYTCSYIALAAPSPQFVEPEKGNFLLRTEGYRFGGDLAKAAYRPAHLIDEWLRPRYWCDITAKGERWE